MKLLSYYKSDGFFWVRMGSYGRGFALKDIRKHDLIFSERNGYDRLYGIGKHWKLKFLKPFNTQSVHTPKIKYVDPMIWVFEGEGSPVEYYTLEQMKDMGIKNRISAVIEHSRQKNKDNNELKTDLIDELLSDGIIKLDLYLKMREAILNPNEEYDIEFNG